ncbi:LamG-like jellyroll fold domain-containing protein [Maridesulfovibrio sp.]|uniref:LamG-like jellyroll fold domain-containing protein n=1 Tax=Maridesulfovibrio sp. TaxID=2795000 RepID=UPI003BAC3F30
MADNDYSYDAPSIDSTPGGDSVKSSILEKNQARVEQSLVHLNTHKNRTDSHGTNSPIVGTDDEQTLTNKTFVDPVINYSTEPAGTSPVTREWVEGQGDLAVNQARTARDEAVQARDEAVAAKDIAVDAAKTLKITPEPVLVGDVSGNEGEDLVFTVTNHKAGVEYQASVTGGTVSVTDGVITWTLPNVDADTDFILTAYASKLGFQQSSAVTKTVSVKEVPIQDGPTMAFADNVEGYPGATVVDGIISAPAHSVGLNNTHQIISAKPEIMVASGKLNLLEGTTESVLKLSEKYTGPVITDQGEGEVISCSEDGEATNVVDILGDGSCRSYFPFDGNANDLGPNAAHISATATYSEGHSGQAAIFPTNVTDMNVPFDPSSVTFSWRVKFTTAHFYSVFATSAGNVGLNWVKNPSNYYIYGLDEAGYQTEFGDLSHIVDDDKFHHVVFTFSASSIHVYVDGVLYYHTDSFTPPTGSHKMTKTSIMASEALDELRVFNKALTSDEVQKIYNDVCVYKATLAQPLSGVPTKAAKSPFWSSLELEEGSTTTSLKLSKDAPVTEGMHLRLPEKEVSAGAVTNMPDVFGNTQVAPIASCTCKVTGGFDVLLWGGEETPAGRGIVSVRIHPRAAQTFVAAVGRINANGTGELVAAGTVRNKSASGIEELVLNEPYIIPNDGLKYYVGVLALAVDSWHKIHACPGKVLYLSGISRVGEKTSANVAVQNNYFCIDNYKYKLKNTGGCKTVDLTHENLTEVPTSAIKKNEIALKLGAGATGEYLGPEKELQLAGGEPVESPIPTGTELGNGNPALLISKLAIPAGTTVSQLGAGNPKGTYAHAITNEKIGIVKRTGADAYEVVKWWSGYSHTGSSSIEYMDLGENYTLPNDGGDYRILFTSPDYVAAIGCTAGEAGGRNDCISGYPAAGESVGTLSWNSYAASVGYKRVSLSTTNEIVVESNDSIKDQIFTAGGLHNKLLVDGQLVEVESVSETSSTKLPKNEGSWNSTVNGDRQMGSIGGGILRTPAFFFTASFDKLTSVTLKHARDTTDCVVYAEVYTVNSENKPETLLGSTNQVQLASPAEHTFTFSSQVDMTVGSKYWIVFRTASGTADWFVETVSYDYSGEYYAAYYDSSISVFDLAQNWSNAFGNELPRVNVVGIQGTKYTTTVTPKTELSKIPTSVAIPDRCTLAPASYTCDLNGDDLKVTGAEIALEDNPDLKRLAMAVSGDDLTFKGGKIYTKEKL